MSVPRTVVFVGSTSTVHDDVALPFDTDAQVRAAWSWLVVSDRIALDWRPATDAADGVHEHLHDFGRVDRLSSGPSADLIRRALADGGLWGCELSRSVVPLVRAPEPKEV